jgi:hypothetical protein
LFLACLQAAKYCCPQCGRNFHGGCTYGAWPGDATGGVSLVCSGCAARLVYALPFRSGCTPLHAAVSWSPDHAATRRAEELLASSNRWHADPTIDPAWPTWQGGAVTQLARAAYEERRVPKDPLDPVRLSLLADALEDAGCTDAELLGHLRSPGPHVRGCWAVDLVLGMS